MKQANGRKRVGTPVKNTVTQMGTGHCAYPIKNSIGTQPKEAGYKKIKGAGTPK